MAHTAFVHLRDAFQQASEFQHRREAGFDVTSHQLIGVLESSCIALRAMQADETLVELCGGPLDFINSVRPSDDELVEFFELEKHLLVSSGFEEDTAKRLCDQIINAIPQLSGNNFSKEEFQKLLSYLQGYVCGQPKSMGAALVKSERTTTNFVASLGSLAVVAVNVLAVETIGPAYSALSIGFGSNFFTSAAWAIREDLDGNAQKARTAMPQPS